MTDPMLQILVGFVLAAGVCFTAWKLGLLSRGGALAACGLGTLVFGLGGWQSAIIMLVFFTSASGLSGLFKQQKTGLREKFSKGHTRDAAQVLANGGLAGGMMVMVAIFPHSEMPWLGFAAALAAATADTWATEIGVLSTRPPRRITDGKLTSRGDSGSVSLLGLVAAFGGSALIAGLVIAVWPVGSRPDALHERWFWGAVLVLAGFLGSLVDSWLGATFQTVYFCPVCCKETEQSLFHQCGATTCQIRGVQWLQNDVVNAFCTVSAVLFITIVSLAVG
jgi:uncharacterized protein (TIGR00297 family)